MIAWLLPIAIGSAALNSGQGDEGHLRDLRCVAGERSALVGVDQVHRFFARRAVAITRAAARSDRAFLALTVSPNATFSIGRGDAGLGIRERGVEGTIELARHVDATRFDFFVPFSGPISTDPCGSQEAELWFAGRDGEGSYQLRFRFELGMLVQVEGREGEVTRGTASAAARGHD